MERLRVRMNIILLLQQFHFLARITVSFIVTLFTFLEHLQHVTTESTRDTARLTNGLGIKRPKNNEPDKRNLPCCCDLCSVVVLKELQTAL